MSALNAVRRLAQVAPKGARSFQSSAARLGGGHADEPEYLHAKSMYNIPAMKNRSFKIGASIVSLVAAGYGIPFVAVAFTQSKTKA